MPENILQMKTDLEKANALFDYVQKTFTWSKDKGIYTDNGIKKCWILKWEMLQKLICISCFCEAGIKADPVMISTVENGLINLVSLMFPI
jgi:hypothetical protein